MSDDSELSIAGTKTPIVNEENDNDSLVYRNQFFIISATSVSMIFILLFFALVAPWWISRDESVKTIQYLVSERISTSSKAFANATEYLMKKYEIACTQLKGLSYDPNVTSCSPSGIQNFIRYAQTMKSALTPNPYRFYLIHNQTAGCQLELAQQNSISFKLYMILPYNQTHDQIKIFDEKTDFSPDRFEPDNNEYGILLKYISIKDSYMRLPNDQILYDEPYWTSGISTFGNLKDNRTLTFIYPQINFTHVHSTTISGIELLNIEILDILDDLHSSSQVNWIILDHKNQILIDKELGAIYPNHIISQTPQYPNIENSPNIKWKEASNFFHLLNKEEPLLINLNDTQYYLIERSITTYKGHLIFDIYMMICYDDLLYDVFKRVNYLFLVVIILSTISIFLHWYFERRIIKRRDKKLSIPYKVTDQGGNNNIEPSEMDNNEGNKYSENDNRYSDSDKYFKLPYFNNGKIGNVILSLRELELTSPEEIMMNKIIDSSINNFSKTQNRIFSIYYTSENSEKCDLCKHLKGESYHQIISEEVSNTQQPQQNFLIYQQKNQKFRPIHNRKGDSSNFCPYQFINLKSDSNINQDLLDEYYQDELLEISNRYANNNTNHLEMVDQANTKFNNNTQEEIPFKTWDVLTFNHFIPGFSSISTYEHDNFISQYDSHGNDSCTNDNHSAKNDQDKDRHNFSDSENLNKNNDNYEDDDIFSINDEKDKIRKKIVFIVLEFIQDKKLIFEDIDPDQIVEFLLYFSRNFMINPYKTFESVKTIEYLFSSDFYQWMNNKLDLLALILSVFIRDIGYLTDEDIIVYLNKERFKTEIENSSEEYEDKENSSMSNEKQTENNNENNNNNFNNHINQNNNINLITTNDIHNIQKFDNERNNKIDSCADNSNYHMIGDSDNNANTDHIIENERDKANNKKETQSENDSMNQSIFNILKMPIFDINSYSNNNTERRYDNNNNNNNNNNCDNDNNDDFSDSSYKNRTKNFRYRTENSIFRKKDVFTLNDTYSRKKRLMETFKYIISKFIYLSYRNFNHVYLIQRISRLLESCDISNHFEILCEFENRAASPNFSVLNNSEDVDIFMKMIFVFSDYSRFWCEKEDFELVFDEYNQQFFTEEELSNKNIVWGFQEEILTKIVKPFCDLLTVFCPLYEMSEKLIDVSNLIQLKIMGKSIDGSHIANFIPSLADIDDNDSGSAENYFHDDFNESRNDTRNKNQNRFTSYRKISNSSESNEYTDEDINIENGNGEDVDGD